MNVLQKEQLEHVKAELHDLRGLKARFDEFLSGKSAKDEL
jgi:hypothetical protein